MFAYLKILLLTGLLAVNCLATRCNGGKATCELLFAPCRIIGKPFGNECPFFMKCCRS